MTLELTPDEVKLIQRGVSYLVISGWASKNEQRLATLLCHRLGCGLLSSIRAPRVDAAPALEEHAVKAESPKAEGREETPCAGCGDGAKLADGWKCDVCGRFKPSLYHPPS